MRVSPPAENQDYGSNVSPAPQDDTGGGSGGVNTKDGGVAVDTPATTIDATAPISITGGAGTSTIVHDASGVAAATYGTAAQIPVFATNATGHITAVTNTPIVLPGTMGFFGDGSDGAFTADGAATPAWATRVGSTYTMTRNAFLTDLTVNSGVRIITSGAIIFGQGTLTGVDATSIISWTANAATGATGGGNLTTVGVYTGSNGTGGTGATTGNGAGGTSVGGNIGSLGGAGGANGIRTGGAGGVVARVNATNGGLQSACVPMSLWTGAGLRGAAYSGGTGGGAGAGDTVSAGGGGGAGGPIVGIAFRFFAGTGKIEAKGGAGGNGVANNASGGGGGGGGGILCYTQTSSAQALWTFDVSGGAKGLKSGAGNDGNDGNTGLIFFVVV